MYSQTVSSGCLTVTDALDSGMTKSLVCGRLWDGRAGPTPHAISGRVGITVRTRCIRRSEYSPSTAKATSELSPIRMSNKDFRDRRPHGFLRRRSLLVD